MKQLTNDEYLAEGGLVCPGCRSDNIEADRMQCDSKIAWCDVSCHNCNATWTDNYALVEYVDFKEGS